MQRARQWALKNPERAKENTRRTCRRRRHIVLQAYGGYKCACCGERAKEFLSLDHINGGGNKERKKHGAGSAFNLWLIKEGFPSGLRVLCFNCNLSLGFHGYCPHSPDSPLIAQQPTWLPQPRPDELLWDLQDLEARKLLEKYKDYKKVSELINIPESALWSRNSRYWKIRVSIWTPQRLTTLREKFAITPSRQLAEELDVPLNRLNKKAYDLSLKKTSAHRAKMQAINALKIASGPYRYKRPRAVTLTNK